MPPMMDKLKDYSPNNYNFIKKKKRLLRRGDVFNILLDNVLAPMGIIHDGLGLALNRS